LRHPILKCCISSKVDLCDFLVLPDLQAKEPSPFSNATDIHTGFVESTFYGGHQLVDPGWVGTKEIEITGLTINITSGDERATSGKSKQLCFREIANDRRNPTLEGR
jgi:hypothetical protein